MNLIADICRSGRIAVLPLVLALTGCAAMVVSQPAVLSPLTAEAPRSDVRAASTVTFRLPTRYERTISAGSLWRPVGRLPQGAVYRSADSVFSIEGRQVHEAYLVVDGDHLVGFYLPGEARFSPLDDKIRLSLGVLQ